MSVIDDIKARLDIVEVVSSYATLQKSGRGFKAVCPFHTEKTPSFVVTPERQSWRCFGACATGGDVFSFVMQAEKLEFRDALQQLAEKTGVELQQRNVEQEDALHRVNRTTANFYQQVLASDAGQAGRAYLERRGVSPQAIERFMLGLSPNSRTELKSYLQTHDMDVEVAIAAGVIGRSDDDGSTWDFFRNRLMFPIFDRQGNVAGFGARALDDSMPKYINTARTPVFDKRATLYALNFAVDSIRQDRTAVIVEGYMDAIAAHEHGYTNVIASMGTALTEQQVSMLRSSADSFVLALDPDVAGQEATLRSLESSWHVIQSGAAQQRQRSHSALAQVRSVDLKVAALPAGQDPDALIREDPAKWERTIEEASPLLDFIIPAAAGRFDLTAEGARAQVVDLVWPLILSLDELDQDHYIQVLADAVGVTHAALTASAGRRRIATRDRRRTPSEPVSEISESALDPQRSDVLEDTALALMISRPDLRLKAAKFGAAYLRKTENREVFTNWMDCAKIEDLWDSLDETLHPHLTHLTNFKLPSADPRRDESGLDQMLKRLEHRYWLEQQETLVATEDPDQPPSKELEHQVVDVNTRIRASEPMRTGHK
ncbi:MAG: DNA primase [SAR202 cluster bacterium]|nr:DNA primase [SAR202 cluster bacterium]